MTRIFIVFLMFASVSTQAQNPLFIPPVLSGPIYELNVQHGTKQFWPGINTPTYGVNGDILAPTLIMNKGEVVTLNVHNNLSSTTTMHWHGFHVAPIHDGGPHQIINSGAVWSPQFTILNNAGTFWYHPHGENKTDLQVSRGIAGMIIIRDEAEAALNLPRTYGVDDIPLIVQTKSFDILHQIQIASQLDTLVMVNATVNAYQNVPAQVVRFRLLNGSSERSYFFGFSNNMSFSLIGTDGGLKSSPTSMNRLRLSPGERAEILVDFSSLLEQTVNLMSYSSELPNGIVGAQTVGNGMAQIPEYSLNPLNGADFILLQLNVVEQTANPVTTIPTTLIPYIPFSVADVDVERNVIMEPMMMGPEAMVEGPFGIDGVQFDMEVINITCQLNDVEVWTITNQTMVAHPFHIHDIQFNVINFNGNTPPPDQEGWKDVVLVMPQQSVSFITKFETFADPEVPYMYHCHLLHHEDEGMMGSFRVVDPNLVSDNSVESFRSYPNPANDFLNVISDVRIDRKSSVSIVDMHGRTHNTNSQISDKSLTIDTSGLSAGVYQVVLNGKNVIRFIKN